MPAFLRSIVHALLVNIAPTAVRTTTLTTAGVDVVDYDGSVIFVLDAAAGGTGTLAGEFQESDTSGGTYTAISGAVFTQVTTAASQQKVTVDVSAAKRFIRFVGTVGGSPSQTYSVNMVGYKKQT